MNKQKKSRGISRRKFIKGAAGSSLTLTLGSLFGGSVFGQEYDITYLQDSGLDSRGLPDLLTEFADVYGIKVKLEEASSKELQSRFVSMLAAGEKVDVYTPTSDALLATLASQGMIRHLEGFPRIEQHMERMLPFVKQAITWEEKPWAFPEEPRVNYWLYNMPMWDKLGGGPLPETWDELTEKAIEAKKKGLAKFPLIWAAGIGGEHLVFQYYNIVRGMGGKAWDEDWNPLFAEKGSAAWNAFKWFVDTFQKWEIANPKSVELRYYPAAREFATGKYLFCQEYNLGHAVVSKREKHPLTGKIGQFLTPGEGGIAWTQPFHLTTVSEKPEKAWTFMEFIGAYDERTGWQGPRMYVKYGYGVGYEELLKDEQTMALLDWVNDLDVWKEAHRTAVHTKVVAPALNAPWYFEWQTKAQPIMHDAILGYISAERAVEKMAEQAAKLKG